MPWVLPGVLVLGVVAVLLARALGRWAGVGPVVAAALVLATGLPLLLTLAPSQGEPVTQPCSWSLPTLSALTRISASSLNVVLLTPLGALVMATRRPLPLLVAAACLPFVIEIVQWVFPGLGRACQGEDLLTNLGGLAAGALLGAGARRAGLV